MEPRPRFLVYERREIVVFVLLGMMVALFSFTLGIHLGKRLSTSDSGPAPKTEAVAMAPEAEHSADDLQLQYQSANQAAEGLLKEKLEEEVKDTGIQVTKPIQIDLPKDKKALKAEKNTANTAAHVPAGGYYSVQVGSYPSDTEAEAQQKNLENAGLKAFVIPVDLGGKGKRYRLLVGHYSTVKAAQEAGQSLQSEKKISAFVVTKVKE